MSIIHPDAAALLLSELEAALQCVCVLPFSAAVSCDGTDQRHWRWVQYTISSTYRLHFRTPGIDLVVSEIRFYRDSIILLYLGLSIFLLSSSATLRATERNSAKTDHAHARKRVQLENVCPKSGVSPLQIGGPKTSFWGKISRLNGNFNGMWAYLRNETLCFVCVE